MIGETVAHYRILSKLGVGGMGVVYKARDLKLDRFVALKFIAPDMSDSVGVRARFLQEARAVSSLNHPNIATLFGIEEKDGNPVLVFEFLQGGTLRQRLEAALDQKGSIPVFLVVDHGLAITEGIAHAHRAGIIHRDIKPSNILFNTEGILKITDFGLAKFATRRLVTRPGSAIGTLAYMSPEQATGGETDQRTDIFSFGATLYELITGKLPFPGDGPVLLQNIMTKAPEPFNRPDVPRKIEEVVFKALQKDPDKRYQHMEDVMAELRGIEVPHMSAERTRTMGSRLASTTRRQYARNLILGGCFAVVATGVVGILAVRPRILRLTSGIPAQKQLAVLPFRNVGADPSNQAFCDGLMETLTSVITQLEQFHGSLWVVPTSEILKQAITTPSEAKKVFGVNLVITGSFQRAGDMLRITTNLVDAATVRQISSRTIDYAVQKSAALQDAVISNVAELLDLEMKPVAQRALAIGRTDIPETYDLYVQGRGYLQRFDQADNLDKAISSFKAALKSDPRYPLAYAGLAQAYLDRYIDTNNPEWLQEAEAAGTKAVDLNDEVAQAHVTLGMVLSVRGRYDAAIRQFRRALDLDPASTDACRELATAYAAANRPKDAEATYRRAIQLRPGYWLGYKDLGVFYSTRQRYADAEASFKKVVELTPDNYIAYRNLGGLYHLMGRYDEAETMLKRSLEIHPSNFAYLNLGTLYYFRGRYRDAARMDEKALELDPNDYLVQGNLADAYRWTPELTAKAPAMYRRAIEAAAGPLAINPESPAILSRLALYHAKLREGDEALKLIAKARSAAASDNTISYRSAIVYELTSRRANAVASLTSAIEGGYSVDEIRREPELAELRKKDVIAKLLSARTMVH